MSEDPQYRYPHAYEDRFICRYQQYDLWLQSDVSLWVVDRHGSAGFKYGHIYRGGYLESRRYIIKQTAILTIIREACLHAIDIIFEKQLDISISPEAKEIFEKEIQDDAQHQEDIPF